MDLFPELRDGSSISPRALYWHYLQSSDQGRTSTGAILEGDWKLIEFFEDGHLELYNLNEDPGERCNLASTFVDRAGELHAKLLEWRKSVGALTPVRDRDNTVSLEAVHLGSIGRSISPELKPAASKTEEVGDPALTDLLAVTPFVVSSPLS